MYEVDKMVYMAHRFSVYFDTPERRDSDQEISCSTAINTCAYM